MSKQELVDRWVETFNEHDAAALAALYSPEASVQDPFYAEPLKGRAAIEQDLAEFFVTFPDLEAMQVSFIESGDTVAAEYSMTGTHQGPLSTPAGEIPPTGRAMTTRGAAVVRYDSSGLIVEERRYYDVAAIMMQLGVTPQTGAAVA